MFVYLISSGLLFLLTAWGVTAQPLLLHEVSVAIKQPPKTLRVFTQLFKAVKFFNGLFYSNQLIIAKYGKTSAANT
jgi:hypothetical protein